MFDQGDVDGEITIAIDELARPIERIDQIKTVAEISRHMPAGNLLFRDDRNIAALPGAMPPG